ncbi:MAG: hypothetical protein CMJ13_07300 [Pelagibacterales bacterium]|nr:hypothetical protein [Pelagibacterales bacterium]|tara:strand:+ start:940 stop:2142 length:1203 start_codon:yes stop_codon:yes gene_type:complete
MKFLLIFFFFNFTISYSAEEIYWELNSEKTIESRIFHKDNAYPKQRNTYSVELKSELFVEPRENINLLLEPFYRYDHHDKERSLLDVSQGYFLYFNDYSELKIGKDKVFWGVAELKNLVDIINTFDSASGEEKSKLGQSLISYSYINDKFGYIDLIYMPEFHKPTQVGESGRLRLNLPTQNYNAIYEGGAGDKVPSWAIKWQNSINETDISFQFFRGTSRDGSTLPVIEDGKLKYFSGFERISQFGTFFQKIYGPLMFKFEGIKRNGQKNSEYLRENYYSYITGVEYVNTRIFNKIWDLNLFAEYINDDRGSSSTDIFQNDIFIGSRISLNNIDGTEINQAFTLDLDGNGNTGNFEVSSRFNESIRVIVEYNYYWSLKSADTLYSFRRDNYLGIKVTNYF